MKYKCWPSNLPQYCILKAGARIGFWQGDVRKLSGDMMELKPTIFAAVPRIINRIYDKIMSEVCDKTSS